MVAQKVPSYEEACVTDERWKSVEIRIVYPVPADDCDLSNDRVFDGLVDKVVDLFRCSWTAINGPSRDP
jgi:hypothetical protein